MLKHQCALTIALNGSWTSWSPCERVSEDIRAPIFFVPIKSLQQVKTGGGPPPGHGVGGGVVGKGGGRGGGEKDVV